MARLVNDTDLHSLPGECPWLLRGVWLCEARVARGERLFGETISLAGYPDEDTTWLIGTMSDGSGRVARWHPRWDGGELTVGVAVETNESIAASLGVIDDVGAHNEWARYAARFMVIFSLLLEAEASPLRVEDQPRRKAARRAAERKGQDGVSTRYVYVEERKRLELERELAARSASGPRADAFLMGVRISGHLKRQHHGPRNSLVKWIYVASYESRRWVAPGHQRIVVT